uniref:Ubiquitin fusion degradation protein 1 homolog n=1 Tax=Clastoptera arizonana TaxID=38151 RepID=A0A1B6C8C2_9HEMI
MQTLPSIEDKENKQHLSFVKFKMLTSQYKNQFHCYPFRNLSEEKRSRAEQGGKIIMPLSVLNILSEMNVEFPLLFKLTNKKTNKITHTGVLEFYEDRNIYLPTWMMRNIGVRSGEKVLVENVTLPVGSYSKFRAITSAFLDITNPKVVLEKYLRQFSCLTIGDVLCINYNNKFYDLEIVETQPLSAVNIIECDLSVDFEVPEPQEEAKQTEVKPEEKPAFAGKGFRLNGKEVKRKAEDEGEAGVKKKTYVRGVPDYEYVAGTLEFLRDSRPVRREEPVKFKAFQGEGSSMLQKKN